MFIQRTQRKGTNGKIYQSVVLMENYRQDGKVKHRTIATITKWPEKVINDLEKILKGKGVFSLDDMEFSYGKSYGAIKTIKEISRITGITKALGNGKQAKLALIQIAARLISQGSRNYIANQWIKNQDVEAVFGIDKFNEDDLYKNLIWLSENQNKIEKKLYNIRHKDKKSKTIFLYDVTSSYFEGEKNELADYGYNRDKKKGKKQIVIGLLTDSEGYPISVEVFRGNTTDTKTVSSQLKKLKELFGVETVIFVGDKGMIKSAQIDEILSDEYKWGYLTTITKEQINTLINKGILQLSLFEDEIVEIQDKDTRYILRRNKYRAEEIKKNRTEKIEYIKNLISEKNKYLSQHKKADTEKAKEKIQEKISVLKISKFINIELKERILILNIDEQAKQKEAELDGCYVVKTQVAKKDLSTRDAHDRYKDLSMVEFVFRTAKTTLEEMRPIYVQKEAQTRGYVFIVMLAYIVSKYIRDATKDLRYTHKFIFESLDKIQRLEYKFKNKTLNIVPKKILEHQAKIIKTLNIKL